MRKTYRSPIIEIISMKTEGILYTASPKQGSDDSGTLPIEAKPVVIETEEWEEEPDEMNTSLPHFTIWAD